MKRLIVNADDFGLTHGVNRAIADCHLHGIVTSATLMATGLCLDDAAELALHMPRLSVGCHVVLVDGEPLLPPNQVRSLLAPGTNRFYHSTGEVLHAVAEGRFHSEEIEAEASAQMARLQDAGMRLSHFDSHKHTHMFPSILRPLLLAASAHGIAALRNPFEAPGVVSLGDALSSLSLLTRKTQTTLLRAFLHRRLARARATGWIFHHGRQLGSSQHRRITAMSLRTMLRRMPPGAWELVCHPGYNDSELAKVRTRLRASREVEMHALMEITESELREQHDVELAAFGDKFVPQVETASTSALQSAASDWKGHGER